MGDPPSSCHHDASVRSIDIGLEEDRLTGKSSEKKKKKWLISSGIPMMHCTADAVLLCSSANASFFSFFQNLYRHVQQGASILVGFHHWLSVGMSVG